MSLADRPRAAINESAHSPQRPLARAIVGVDGSDAAVAACSFGLWLAGKADIETTLVHVCPDLRDAAPAGATADPRASIAAAGSRLQETSEWRARLADLSSYAAADASVERVVRRGPPARVLVAEAVARRADAILIGSTGVGMPQGRFLGSVSSKVVEDAPCSVMVFREGQPAAPADVRAVVVGVDGSVSSLEGVAVGGQLARALDARLVLATSSETNVALAPPPHQLRAELRRHATRTLHDAQLRTGGGLEVLQELGEGRRPRDLLMAACQRHGPAVLVVGSRGRGVVTATVLGSTSRWLVNHATCPVVVVRHADGDEA